MTTQSTNTCLINTENSRLTEGTLLVTRAHGHSDCVVVEAGEDYAMDCCYITKFRKPEKESVRYRKPYCACSCGSCVSCGCVDAEGEPVIDEGTQEFVDTKINEAIAAVTGELDAKGGTEEPAMTPNRRG